MRNAMVQLCLVVIGVTSVHAVKLLQTSSLHFTVLPAEEADNVWAIQDKDSIKMVGINGEYYLTTLHPGRWQIRVDAKKPYRSAGLTEVVLGPGGDKDLGQMQLKR